MMSKRWLILLIVGFLLVPVNLFVPDAAGETWENEYGKLSIYPDVSTGIITQVQYCDLTSYIDDAEIDVTFRFDIPVKNPDIWMWRNISHLVSVPDYGMIESSYILVNISDITVIDEPEFVDFGDIPSDLYRQGTASFWDDDMIEWVNGTFDIGFDSFEWLNPEHTSATFYYSYYGVVGYHMEEQYWFDWDNIKDLFSHVEYGGKHYYYVRSWMIKNKEYNLKWQYDIPLGSDGKWDLFFKKSSDPLGTWRVSIDPWWDSDWGFYKVCNIVNKVDEYQMKILIDYNDDVGGNVSLGGNCNTNFSDIRFVLADGNNDTLLPYWIENSTDGSQATMWVNNTGNLSEMILYFGNAAVGNVSDGFATFDLFDDFEDAGAGIWTTTSGTPDYSSTTQAYGGSQSMELGSNEAATIANYVTDEDSAIQFMYWRTSGRKTILNLPRRDTTDHRVHIVAWDDDTIDYYDTAYREVGASLASTWFKLETRNFNWGSSTFDFLMNDEYLKDDGDINSIDGLGDEILFSESNGFGPVYFDNFIIRKFLIPQPSWSSFDSEQTQANNPPTLSGEAPTNTSTGISTTPSLYVICTDADSDTMNATWRSNSSGSWVDFATNLSISTGTNITQSFTNASAYLTTYWWSVNLSDGTNWTNDTYHFTTMSSAASPVLSNEYPTNNSVSVCPNSMEIGITVSDANADTMNITFWSNLSGVWDYFYTGTINRTLVDVANGTYYIDPVFFTRYNYVYYWNVSVSDGTFTNDSSVYSFTTASSPCGKGGGGGIGGSSVVGVIGICGIFGLIGLIMNRRRKHNE